MVIKWKRLHPLAQIPQTQSKGAACVDLVAVDITLSNYLVSNKEDPYNCALIKLGFSSEIPEGYKAVIVPRSSFTQKGWVMQNSPAQIDSDYRGEWMLKFQSFPVNFGFKAMGDSLLTFEAFCNNVYYPEFPFKVGDRVAQCYIEKVILPEFIEAEELDSTERGSGGFGSTNSSLSEIEKAWKMKNMY